VDGPDQDVDTPNSPTTEGTSTLKPAATLQPIHGSRLSLDPWTGRLIGALAVVDHGVAEWACRDCWSAQRFH
jgi:hypothetical protein